MLLTQTYKDDNVVLAQFMAYFISSNQLEPAQLLASQLEQNFIGSTPQLKEIIRENSFYVNKILEDQYPESRQKQLLQKGRRIIESEGRLRAWVGVNNLTEALGLFEGFRQKIKSL